MKVTSVKLWNNYPYQDGAMTVWKPGSPIPAPTWSLDVNVMIPKTRALTEVRLPVAYSTAYKCNYIEMTTDIGVTLDGWIDDVEELASDFVVCAITWHRDLWKMFIQNAAIGKGIVTRRKMTAGEALPPQPYPVGYWEAKSNHRIDYVAGETSSVQLAGWCYVSVISSGQTSELKRYCWPITSEPGKITALGNVQQACVPTDLTIAGRWDEALGVDPTSVVGAWFSPVSPYGTRVSLSGSTIVVTTSMIPVTLHGQFWVCEWKHDSSTTVASYPCMTDDTHQYDIVGWDTSLIGTTPWGVAMQNWQYHTVVNSTTAYVVLEGMPTVNAGQSVDGVRWCIPLVPLDVTSNAVTSFNVSGAREADRMQIRLDADKARVSGHMGTVNAAIGGGIAGGMAGGPIGAITGIGGAVLGAVANTITTEANYRYATGEFADRAMDIADYRAAHQSNNLVMAGSVEDAIYFGVRGLMIVEARPDGYSAGIRDTDIQMYGAHVCEPTASCQALVNAGGPLQIANCEVKGPIPAEARQYIKERLARGVVIE